MKLKDKVALITGGSRGIGMAIALEFSKEGAKIAVNYNLSEKEAKEVEKQIKGAGGEVFLIQANVSNTGDVKSMIDKVIEQYGGIDILVNNASVYPKVGFFDCSEADFDRAINTNLKSLFFCSQTTAKYMLKQGEGNIINISSNAAFIPKKDKGILYRLSKRGVISLTEDFAKTLAPNIRVNAIAPGYTKTKMIPYLSDDKIRSEIEKSIPLQKVNEPEDIAKVALFLASEDSRNITGETIIVDGGFILR